MEQNRHAHPLSLQHGISCHPPQAPRRPPSRLPQPPRRARPHHRRHRRRPPVRRRGPPATHLSNRSPRRRAKPPPTTTPSPAAQHAPTTAPVRSCQSARRAPRASYPITRHHLRRAPVVRPRHPRVGRYSSRKQKTSPGTSWKSRHRAGTRPDGPRSRPRSAARSRPSRTNSPIRRSLGSHSQTATPHTRAPRGRAPKQTGDPIVKTDP